MNEFFYKLIKKACYTHHLGDEQAAKRFQTASLVSDRAAFERQPKPDISQDELLQARSLLPADKLPA